MVILQFSNSSFLSCTDNTLSSDSWYA